MQLLNTGVKISPLTTHAINHTPVQSPESKRPSNQVELKPRKLAAKASGLIKVPFQTANDTPLALAEACSPSDIGQYLMNGRGSFAVRPIFRGQDVSVITRNEGCAIDFHESEPFRMSKAVVSFLKRKARLHRQFLDGDEVRLACRYLKIPGIEPSLDVYQDTLLRHGKILLKDRALTLVGQPASYRPLTLDINKSDASAAFKAETRRVLAEIARKNAVLLAEIEALLWFPTTPQTVGCYQTVRVDVSSDELASFK